MYPTFRKNEWKRRQLQLTMGVGKKPSGKEDSPLVEKNEKLHQEAKEEIECKRESLLFMIHSSNAIVLSP